MIPAFCSIPRPIPPIQTVISQCLLPFCFLVRRARKWLGGPLIHPFIPALCVFAHIWKVINAKFEEIGIESEVLQCEPDVSAHDGSMKGSTHYRNYVIYLHSSVYLFAAFSVIGRRHIALLAKIRFVCIC